VPKRSKQYEGVSKSFRTGRLELELQVVQLSATRCSCIAILWVSLLRFATITLCVASQPVFIVVSIYSLSTQSGNVWIHPRISSVYFKESRRKRVFQPMWSDSVGIVTGGNVYQKVSILSI